MGGHSSMCVPGLHWAVQCPSHRHLLSRLSGVLDPGSLLEEWLIPSVLRGLRDQRSGQLLPDWLVRGEGRGHPLQHCLAQHSALVHARRRLRLREVLRELSSLFRNTCVCLASVSSRWGLCSSTCGSLRRGLPSRSPLLQTIEPQSRSSRARKTTPSSSLAMLILCDI